MPSITTPPSPAAVGILPAIYGSIGAGLGAAGGLLPGGSGAGSGAIRGGAAGAGLGLGQFGANTLGAKAGLTPQAISLLSILTGAAGGYGGYRAARRFTKTPGEDAKDQIDAEVSRRKKQMAKQGSTTQVPWMDADPKKLLLTALLGLSIPTAAGAGIGSIGGALSPRGSGLLPGMVRGGLAGAGYTIGGLGGMGIANAAGIQNPLGRAALGIGGSLVGGMTGYRMGRKLTKTRKEQLEDAMLEWYNDENSAPQPPPKMASGEVALCLL